MKFIKQLTGVALATALVCTGCSKKPAGEESYTQYPIYEGDDLELVVNDSGTHFAMWSPEAQAARVRLYNTDLGGEPYQTLDMDKDGQGVWRVSVPEQLYGKFYTFSIKYDGNWLAETPGIWAKAVGANGLRAAIIDFAQTNPEGWDQDKGPVVENITDA